MSCDTQLAQIETTVNSIDYSTNGINRVFLFNFENIENQIVDLGTTVNLSALTVTLKEYIISDGVFNDDVTTDEFGVVYTPSLRLSFDGLDGVKNQFIKEIAQPSARVGAIVEDSRAFYWLLGRYNGLGFATASVSSDGGGYSVDLTGNEIEPIRQISGVLNLPTQVVTCQPFTQVIVSASTGGGSFFDCASLLDCSTFTDALTDISVLQSDLNGKVNQSQIVQVTGTSTTNIMSQNAVTNALSNLNVDVDIPDTFYVYTFSNFT